MKFEKIQYFKLMIDASFYNVDNYDLLVDLLIIQIPPSKTHHMNE